MELELIVLPAPAEVGAAGWDEFVQAWRILDDAQVAAYRTEDVRIAPEDGFAWYRDAAEENVFVLAVAGGELAGFGELSRLYDDTSGAGWTRNELAPGVTGTDVLDRIDDRIEALARDRGLRRLSLYQPTRAAPGPRLAPPTGAGSLPADDPKVRWLLSRGYRLEQVERGSRYPLPPDPAVLARLEAAAAGVSSGYRIRTWIGSTASELRDDLATLFTRMSTDAPSAGLEEPLDEWTAERLAAVEAVRADGEPELLTAAAEDLATGRLVGFTQLRVPLDPRRAVIQESTLVLREHRGHRLGMRLKLANLAYLAAIRPGHPSVVTWNAEENRPMLDVNEAVGFLPIGTEGGWRKDLA